jgi:hypothetical protein
MCVISMRQQARNRPHGRSGNPADRPRGCRDHVNRAARDLLAGEGEALTCKAVELGMGGDAAALRLCLERWRTPMPRPPALKPRLDPVKGRRTAAAGEADGAARGHRRLLRAKTAIGAMVRHALAVSGADIGAARRLVDADAAEAALAAIPDTPVLRDADRAATPPLGRAQRRQAEAFEAKISAMAEGIANGRPLDLANASLAELFAWSLAQRRPQPPLPSPPPGFTREGGGPEHGEGEGMEYQQRVGAPFNLEGSGTLGSAPGPSESSPGVRRDA